MEGRGLDIAYLQFGPQSGVTANVAAALEALGHRVRPLQATGPLERRDPAAGRRRPSARALLNVASATFHYRGAALHRRWSTPFAFDVHSARAGELVAQLRPAPDVVLQNGVLFAPGRPPRAPYVLLLDYTSALANAGGDGRVAGGYPRSWLERERATYEGARAICTFSARTAESVRRDYGIAAQRVHVVGAGANVFPDAPLRLDDGHTILFVGIAFERKGGLVLLEAFRRVRARDPRASLLVAGPTQPLDLPPGAVQVGRVAPEALPALFARATVFTMPSLREPFGLAYLDAMACGVPCVGTATDAIPEILGGDAGLVVPPRDPAALAAALLDVMADPQRARAMGRAGRRRVEAGCRWEHVARRLEAVLLEAAEDAARRSDARPLAPPLHPGELPAGVG
jgi:glycosyltransferase involved in cell wall biosynthesis